MRNHPLIVYVEDAETRQMAKLAKSWHVQGATTDEAYWEARALLAREGLPRVRAMNKTADGKIVVYCAQPHGTQPVEGLDLAWAPPAR
jgi:hypothetical protein